MLCVATCVEQSALLSIANGIQARLGFVVKMAHHRLLATGAKLMCIRCCTMS